MVVPTPEARPITPRICPHSGLTLYPVFDRHGKVRWVTIPKDDPPARVRPDRGAAWVEHGQAGPNGDDRRSPGS
jgi:hypothetical protein